MKRSTIRGVRITREPYERPGGVLEYLRYTIDVFDEREKLVEVLGRLADLAVAHAAFAAAIEKYPDKPSSCASGRASSGDTTRRAGDLPRRFEG